MTPAAFCGATEPALLSWRAATNRGFIGAAFQADGAYASGWGILAGGTFEPASIEAVKAGRTQMRRSAGNYPASVNEENWPRLFERVCAENQFKRRRCGSVALHADQQALSRDRGQAVQGAAGKVPHHYGEIRLHGVCLYPDGAR